jgi:glutamyl-tRNA synthetase
MTSSPTIVRFAPSPTGRIHIGNARTAILNWLFAQKTGGQFILRYDDTDVARSTQAYAEGIAADIAWLGITPARVEWQSKRFARYDAVVADMKAKGQLYPCYETADELERRRKRQEARGGPRVYDRAALKLSAEERAALEAQGRKPHWRFKLDSGVIEWNDLIRGSQHTDLASQSDPVLVREDSSYLYTLPSVIDDIDFGITHVIRGEDHVTNAGVQVAITQALGGTPPVYAHHSLLVGADGKGLSKRLGSLSIAQMREDGFEAMAVVSHAALLGTSDNIHPCADYAELVAGFDMSKISRAPGRFDEKELADINAKLLHMLPWSAVQSRLPAASEALWLAVRGNIEKLSGVAAWAAVVAGPVARNVDGEDAQFITAARELLPAEPWDSTTWRAWTTGVSAATGRKGKSLFMPLRRALTGLDHGPELAALLPLIGRQRVLERLS